MRAMYASVNDATVSLLHLHGCEVSETDAGCCGALEMHLGFGEAALTKARRVIDSFRGEELIITNSAGCGSMMKAYANVLGGDPVYAEKAKQFSLRVRDICEFLCETGFRAPKAQMQTRVTYHDACHLAHGQRVVEEPRRLLEQIPGLSLVPLEESDRCCGSAGVYNITQPALARELLERKWSFVEQTGAETVAAGNPGCLAWLEQAAQEKGSKVRVAHTAEVLLEAMMPTRAP